MTKKQKYHKLFMDSAVLAGSMSFCKRKKVGAVIVKNNRILINSWNGTVEGSDNCCEKKNIIKKLHCTRCDNKGFVGGYSFSRNKESDVIVCHDCDSSEYIEYTYTEELETIPDVVHAEKNAIAYAAREGIKTKGCSLYVTMSPCVPCAILMKQAGIKKVFYKEKYRDTSGIEFLESVGIIIKQI